jgi:hypothetical protein
VDESADTSQTIDIEGSLDAGTGVDLFKLDIVNPLFFSVETVDAGPFGIPDTDLFLFDASGNGVYANDDDSAGTLSCLPAFFSAATLSDCSAASTTLGPQTAGIYYLAVAYSANSPVDAGSNEIFTLNGTDIVGPNGVGPLAGWDGGSFTGPNTDLVNYHIEISDAPEPAAWPVTGGLCVGLILFRRKLRRV